MDSNFLFGISLTASFLAGVLALFAPCCITFLFPSYLASKTHLTQVRGALAMAQKRPISKQAESMAKLTNSINQRIKIVSAEEHTERFRNILERILSHKQDGIYFIQLDFSGENILLKGRARSRSSFLSFLSGIKNDDAFGELNSPISSLIATSSLDFSIQMKILPKNEI